MAKDKGKNPLGGIFDAIDEGLDKIGVPRSGNERKVNRDSLDAKTIEETRLLIIAAIDEAQKDFESGLRTLALLREKLG